MESRTKAILFFFSLGTALVTAGCGRTPQQTRFQAAFLPRPLRTTSVELTTPPSLPNPSRYTAESPGELLKDTLTVHPKADSLMRQAELRYQRGRRFYLLRDIPAARTEFDASVDLVLEASAENPAARKTYEEYLDSIVESIHRFDLAENGGGAGVGEEGFEKAPLEDILEMTFPVDPKLKDKVREQVAATVSQLPLSFNDTVLSYIQYFSNRGRKTLIYGLQRSGRYRPMIQRILDEEGIPQELIHLAQAESGFMPRAMSRMKAGGMWQFLASRGKEYGLTRTEHIDERMDPEKATRAAARHLRDLYNMFGDWYLAIAAYNCGPVTVEKAVERTGYADFWMLRSRGVLPAETTNYVPIILAMALMAKNAQEYGIENVELDRPNEYDTVEIAAPTSMALISDITETPLPELAGLNPAVLKNIAPAGYAAHVPKGSGNQLMVALQAVPLEKRAAWRMHRVGFGETLSDIAKMYEAPEVGILEANKLESPNAVEGDRLVIPLVTRPPAPAKRTAASRSKRASARPAASTSRAGKSKAVASKSTSRTTARKTAAKAGSAPRTKTPAKANATAAKSRPLKTSAAGTGSSSAASRTALSRASLR